jgi:hypothetical protein
LKGTFSKCALLETTKVCSARGRTERYEAALIVASAVTAPARIAFSGRTRPLDSRNQIRPLPCPAPPRQRRGKRYLPAAVTNGAAVFKEVAHDAWHIKPGSATIDGKIVLPTADGTTDFSFLRNKLNAEFTN